MKLDYRGTLKRMPHTVGAWLLHGNEPLLEQNLLQRWRRHWEEAGIERQRFDINTVNDWRDVFNALNSLSLFSSQLAIEVHGNIKPDQAGLDQLKSFIQSPADNLLLMIMPLQDQSARKAKFFQLIEANANVVQLTTTTPHERLEILQEEARLLNIQLEPEAWQLLLAQTENNLFAAHQQLLRLADVYTAEVALTTENLLQALSEQSRFSSFDLTEAALQGNAVQAIKILNFLFESGEADSLILWALARDMRLLMQLFEQPGQYQKFGIWQNKIPLYQRAVKRLQANQLLLWPKLLQQTDEAIKGANDHSPKDLLLQVTMALCGNPLFNLHTIE